MSRFKWNEEDNENLIIMEKNLENFIELLQWYGSIAAMWYNLKCTKQD